MCCAGARPSSRQPQPSPGWAIPTPPTPTPTTTMTFVSAMPTGRPRPGGVWPVAADGTARRTGAAGVCARAGLHRGPVRLLLRRLDRRAGRSATPESTPHGPPPVRRARCAAARRAQLASSPPAATASSGGRHLPGQLPWRALDDAPPAATDRPEPRPAANDVAVLQYTWARPPLHAEYC